MFSTENRIIIVLKLINDNVPELDNVKGIFPYVKQKLTTVKIPIEWKIEIVTENSSNRKVGKKSSRFVISHGILPNLNFPKEPG